MTDRGVQRRALLRGVTTGLVAVALWMGGPIVQPRAQDGLAAAKAAGYVGERPDGLVGFVTDAVPAEVRQLVERVNAERLERYRRIAENSGASLEQVQRVAGAELMARTPPGQYVMNAAGRWVRK